MAILVQSNKKPSVSFPSQTGSIVTFNSQYAGLPLKSHKVDIDSVSGVSDIIIGNCDSDTALLWTIDNSFNGDVEFNQWIGLYGHLPTDSGLYNRDTYTVNGVTYTKNNDGTISIQTTAEGATDRAPVKIGNQNTLPNFNIGSNHIFYFSLLDEDVLQTECYLEWNSLQRITPLLIKDITSVGFNMWIVVRKGTVISTPIIATPQMIDITQIFGSMIADYIYNLEQNEAGAGIAFFKHIYPNNYYPYNVGTKEGVGNSTTINIGSTVNEGEYDARTGILEVTSPSVQTIQLQPCPIDTLQGENNLFASTGETTVSHIKIGG